MPYGKRKIGNKIKVINKVTGRVLGTHSSDAAANRQLAALHIHVKDSRPRRKRRKK